MQLRASRSGASSGSGKEGWFLRAFRREVMARRRVSRFPMDESRVRRMSAPEKRLKTSSTDSGSSQNWSLLAVWLVRGSWYDVRLSSMDHWLGCFALQRVKRCLA